MSSDHEFPWANQPLAVRTLLTGLTLPIATPILMLLMVGCVLVTVCIPFAYVIAGLRGKLTKEVKP